MKHLLLSLVLCLSLSAQDSLPPYTTPEQVPQNTVDLWSTYDPRAEDLAVKVLQEWKEDGVVMKLLTFKVGTFKGAESRVCAYYCYPENGQKNAAFVYAHGGGQRAERGRGKYFATQGYATIDINWGGRDLADASEVNTDWGKIDPSQGPQFYKKALRKHYKGSLTPDEHSIDPVMSPRNSNWHLLALTGRRAITFLEQQAEVDPQKIGFTGFSMGGTITSMTATDGRLKAVAPFVGGTGYLDEDFPGIERTGDAFKIKDLQMYRNTADPAAYWKHVTCPIMFISSSNDFHAAFDKIYQSMDDVPHKNWNVSTLMHNNHGPTGEQWITLNLWFDHYLKGEPLLTPKTPASSWKVEGERASFQVTPDNIESLKNVEIYYSYDPNPRTRFWQTFPKENRQGNTWHATLTIKEGLPLYAFALCRYKLPSERTLERGSTETFNINYYMYRVLPETLDITKLKGLANTGTLYALEQGIADWHTPITD